MEEKKITKAEFDAAVVKASEKITSRPEVEGMAAVLIQLTGMTFAREMSDILFPEDETEGSEEC